MFENFLKEKRFLQNVTPETLQYYHYVFNRWKAYVGAEEPTEKNIKTFVIKIRESGVSIFTANSYIRGFNSYLAWLGTGLKIKKLKEPEQILEVFTDREIKALISFKGRSIRERKMHALITLIVDTGMRIDEALNLKKGDVNFDNLLVKVVQGKGRKDRIIPISHQCRKVLFLFKHESQYLFPSRDGGPWAYPTALNQFKALCKELGIGGRRHAFHNIRHYFAISYLRNGGDLFRLSRLLGHTDIATTQIYLKHMTFDPIREAHQLYSPLARL